MLHITPWNCSESLLFEAYKAIKNSGLLIIYGPFKRQGNYFSKNNKFFDYSLKNQNQEWGLRDIDKICRLSESAGFTRNLIIPMVQKELLSYCDNITYLENNISLYALSS